MIADNRSVVPYPMAHNHITRPSILSSEADQFDDEITQTGANGPVKYRGFLNAVGILLVCT